MVFSSLVFVFGFLPLCLILVIITYKWTKTQNVLLLLASMLFYTWGEPKYIWLFSGTIFTNWLLVLSTVKITNRRIVRAIGIFTIGLDLLILFWFKYAGWIGGAFHLSIGSIVLPIGISFYTFQAISYVADVTLLDKYEVERNPINVGLYIAFFPQLIAGPIVRYEDMREQIKNRRMSFDGFEAGCFRFVLGFYKKVLLADSMAVIANKAFGSGDNLTFSFAWLGAIAYSFQILMDFSGYSDMAIGLGAMFGFRIPENFDNPYKASTIRDFWRRWHITLSIWFRDYVYIPLGGSRRGKQRTIFNIAVVWLLTGFWHGANLTFVLWGVIYGFFVITEKFLDTDRKLKNSKAINRIIYRVFSLLIVMLLWVLFRAENIQEAGCYIFRMFQFGTTRFSETVLYFSEYKYAFTGCVLLSILSTDTLMRKRTILWPVMLVVFVVSISYLVKGTFSPFLYFNF